MDGFFTTAGSKYPVQVERINTFRIVENGTPFEMNGVKVTKVNLEDTTSLGAKGTNITITQEGTGKSVSAFAEIYLNEGKYGYWESVERGSTGHWWIRDFKPELVKAVLFGSGNYDMVLVKLN